jgi:ribosome maturation factor RimP
MIGVTYMEKDTAEKIVKKIAEELNCYVVDFRLNLRGRRTFIKVTAESNNGITVQQTGDISKRIRSNEKFNELFQDYQLEVTSPGLGYHLKTERDFLRNKGRTLELFFRDSDIKSPITGELIEINKDSISILTSDNNIEKLKLSKIDYGKIKLKW